MLDPKFVKDMPKLGFGLMRLPLLENGEIDIPQTCEMVDMFMAKGFNYFDTAYGYGNGASERAIKAALVDRYPRDQYYLATKLPAWAGCKTAEEAKQMFYTSLERTGAGYFDFYLLHNLGQKRTQTFEDFGIWDYVKGLKEQGLVKHWGFSFHDSAESLEKILQAHPDPEFVQLQINYIDWEDGKVQSRKCWEVARKYNKPVVIMEPVKGGNLANPSAGVRAVFDAANPDVTPASWAIRYAASLEGVLTVLSGMSTVAQMQDNLNTMTNFQPMTDAELAVIDQAREAFAAIPTVPCTSCEYCVKGCPKNINIPSCFTAMKDYAYFQNKPMAQNSYNWNTTGQGRGKASDCIGCGACEEVCPQHISIREELAKAVEIFEK